MSGADESRSIRQEASRASNCSHKWLFVLACVFVLFHPLRAAANVPIPSLYGFAAPFFFTISTQGLLFLAIVLIEGGIYWVMTRKRPWYQSFAVVLLANIASSFFGLLIAGSPCCLLLVIIAPFYIYHIFTSKWKYNPSLAAILSSTPIILTLPLVFAYPEARALETRWIYISLFCAYWLSVLIEGMIFRGIFKTDYVWSRVFLANAASYLLLLIIPFFIPHLQGNNLISYDYLWVSGRSFAEAGEYDRALEMIDRMRELRPDEEYDHLYWDLDIALIIARKGELKIARQIVDRVLATPRKDSTWDRLINEKLERVERILELRTKQQSPDKFP